MKRKGRLGTCLPWVGDFRRRVRSKWRFEGFFWKVFRTYWPIRRRHITNACLSLVNSYKKFSTKLTPPLARYPSSKVSDFPEPFFYPWAKIFPPDDVGARSLWILLQRVQLCGQHVPGAETPQGLEAHRGRVQVRHVHVCDERACRVDHAQAIRFNRRTHFIWYSKQKI